MSRRHFIRKMLATIKNMAILSFLPPVSLTNATVNSESDRLHYKPLNGRSLRNIARDKLHHGSQSFVNPLGPERRGRFWQVMRWKLFHENRLKKSFAEERVVPVSIDWEPIRRHRGL